MKACINAAQKHEVVNHASAMATKPMAAASYMVGDLPEQKPKRENLPYVLTHYSIALSGTVTTAFIRK